MATARVDMAAESGRMLDNAIQTMTGVLASTLPREHGEKLKFVMEMYGLDPKQPFALTRETIEGSVDRITRALGFEVDPNFRHVCLAIIASNLLGTMATNL